MKRKAHLMVAIGVFLVLGGTAQAQTYLFDFQGDSEGGSHPGTTATGAVQVFDLSSPVHTNGITLTASAGNTLANSRNRGANDGPNSDITRDFIQWATAGPITITISGLVAHAEYAFTIWSGDLAANQIKTTRHTLAGASGSETIDHTSVSLAEENATGGSQVDFTNVVSTASGELTYTIQYLGGGGTATTLNGMQISFVPPLGTVIIVK